MMVRCIGVYCTRIGENIRKNILNHTKALKRLNTCVFILWWLTFAISNLFFTVFQIVPELVVFFSERFGSSIQLDYCSH